MFLIQIIKVSGYKNKAPNRRDNLKFQIIVHFSTDIIF